jgi:hypothetical protein
MGYMGIHVLGLPIWDVAGSVFLSYGIMDIDIDLTPLVWISNTNVRAGTGKKDVETRLAEALY